ncbi:hypothetical protein PMI15_00267 [Polaromonas sp. CF318]|uniref:hypothetical protein n=1 Tax=Polaromonas sp. CF318 TaxID=1144318 RepID=UPI0002710F9E|nr:hypothetical protein [Polaromonas sp. CF318]EJL90454.1 hypothetical protein PMI15_00267 [Polaromonas sp. CF318]
MTTDLENFLHARITALRTLNIAYFKSQCPGASDEVALIGLHKARYECREIEASLRLESGEWLRAHGYGRLRVGEILPTGELPK